MQSGAPVIKDLVLIGGGHTHVAVLRAFGMRPLPGARITLVSRDTLTPYSGMLPGLIAGRYTAEEAHIDLVPLCEFAGARFIKAEATGLDTAARRVLCAGRPPVPYDLVSIDCGSTPTTASVSDPDAALIPVKPIDRFRARFDALLARLAERTAPATIAVVGGGVGGVELLLAVTRRLTRGSVTRGGVTRGVRPQEGSDPDFADPDFADPDFADPDFAPELNFALLTDGADILMEHPPRVRARLRRHLAARGVKLYTNARVSEYRDGVLRSEQGLAVEADEVLWVTNAAAPPWIAASGLATDEGGFLLVDACLNAVSDRNVFGAGDAATMRDTPRPKSGVFAVRQGRPLYENLRRALLGQRLVSYRPQREFLRLIGTGDGAAVAVRGPFSAEGRWAWRWKDWIDRRFMRRYQELPEMKLPRAEPAVPRALARQFVPDDDGMRCGGCGAKVSADVLAAALAELGGVAREDIVVGLEAPDDAAVVAVAAGKLAVLSVDAFRPIVADPFLFGQIAAQHCLNDLFAMGAEPQSALTIATLPVWPEKKLVAELRQMLAGALRVFEAEGAALVGGHTSEGAETSLGFSVTGLIAREALLRKASLRADDVLVLSKALGTGCLFAANMRAKAKGVWIDAALASMLQSNRAAAEILRAHGALACTDVTGFGLIGHALEMLGTAPLSLTLALDAFPALPGAREALARGFRSTLAPKNERAAERALGTDAPKDHPLFPLLFDPQTAGGLLAGVPAPSATACVEALREAGFGASAIVGKVEARASAEASLRFAPQ